MVWVEDVWKRFRLRENRPDSVGQWLYRLVHRKGGREARAPFWALKGVSFEVEAGDSLGVVGRNGSGKSTLLKLLSGTLQPTRGRIRLGGRVSSLIELGAGFHPDFTGRENVYLNGLLLGLRRREISRRLDDIVAFAELERFIDVPVKYYSSGMYMRLAFAVATQVSADILIIDEILAVGDAAFQQKCMARIRELQSQGTTLLLVSHSAGQVLEVCRRVLWLEEGQPVFLGDAAEGLRRYLGEDAVPRPPAAGQAAR